MSSNMDESARKLGRMHGKASASWVFDGNTSSEHYLKVLAGIEQGDPAIMEMEPSPLSGEFADGITIKNVYDAAGVPLAEEWDDPDQYSYIIDAYEDGFGAAFWAEVERVAHYHTDGETAR